MHTNLTESMSLHVTCFFPQKHAIQEKLLCLVYVFDFDNFFFFIEKYFLQDTMDLDCKISISKPLPYDQFFERFCYFYRVCFEQQN